MYVVGGGVVTFATGDSVGCGDMHVVGVASCCVSCWWLCTMMSLFAYMFMKLGVVVVIALVAMAAVVVVCDGICGVCGVDIVMVVV